MNRKWLIGVSYVVLTGGLLLVQESGRTIRNGNLASTKESQAVEAEATEEPPTLSISLTQEERDFLNQLWELMDMGDLEGAARTLNQYKIPWKEFPCMYDGTDMKLEVSDGHGLVFTKNSTVFYGEFQAGMPQGKGTALQVLELEEGKRYDYAFGTWEQGMLSGEGACGYNYYDGAGQDMAKTISKTGTFKENLLEGEITYISTNGAGEATAWQFQVADGVIVADDRWIKEADSSGSVFYRLMAEDVDDHAYILSESAMGESRWKNLIEYDTVKVEE